MQEAEKHRLRVEAAIVTKAVFIQVGLQVMAANIVIGALDPVLDQRPESFNGLRMNVASNIDFLAMANAAMVVIVRGSGESVIRRIVIGENEIRWQKVLLVTSDVTNARTLPLRWTSPTTGVLAFLSAVQARPCILCFPPKYISSTSTGFLLPPSFGAFSVSSSMERICLNIRHAVL